MQKKSRLFVIILIFFTLILTHYFFRSGREGQDATFFDRVVVLAYQPFVKVFNGALDTVSGIFNNYLFLVQTKKENEILKDTVQLLRLQNRSLRDLLRQEYDEAKASQSYSFLNKEIIRVNILGYDPIPQSRTLWIDAGKDKNIKINSVVVAGEGLVGKVIQVFDKSSKVLLLIDNYFSVDVFNARTSMRCLVKGMGPDEIQAVRVPYLSQIEFMESGSEFHHGDLLLTSGLGGVFPKGIPVGQIVDISRDEDGFFYKSAVLPAVDFSKMQNLYVVLDDKEQ